MITWKELDMISNPNVIDIRNISYYNISHYPNARNISSIELTISPEKYLNKREKYYIYCQSGITSVKLTQTLNKKGYNVVNIIGGYQVK